MGGTLPSVWPRMRRNADGAALEVRQFFREVDPDALAPRAAALVFLLGGLLTLALTLLVPDLHKLIAGLSRNALAPRAA